MVHMGNGYFVLINDLVQKKKGDFTYQKFSSSTIHLDSIDKIHYVKL